MFDLLNKYKEEKTVLEGQIKLITYSEEFQQNIIVLDLEQAKVIIKKEDFDVVDRNLVLYKYVGKKIKFVITDIVGDTVYASRKLLKEAQRDEMIKRLENGEEFEAKIVYLQTFGAYLDIEGTQVILRNMDYALDHTRVMDMNKIGDTIKVKLNRISTNKKIFVEAIEKYCSDTVINFEDFERGQVVLGTIKTLKTTHCYVGIAPNLDVLTPVPEFYDIEPKEGMRVTVRLTKIMPEEQRIRGKVINLIEDRDLDLD